MKDKRSPGSAPPSFNMARTSPSRFRLRTVVRTSMARGQELQDAMAADEARSTGNQNRTHRRHLILLLFSAELGVIRVREHSDYRGSPGVMG